MHEYLPDDLDYKILQIIANDARISFLEVSRVCNVSGAAVHQRVQKMIAHGIITGSEFNLNMSLIGFKTCAFVSLSFAETAELESIVEKLKAIPEIMECHCISGIADLLIKVYAMDNSHLLRIIRQRIKPLGAVKADPIISYGELFHRQMTFPKGFAKEE